MTLTYQTFVIIDYFNAQFSFNIYTFFCSYKQCKFNLFREECEGFAKLVTELNSTFSEQTNGTDLIGIVQSLIGGFLKVEIKT